MVRIETEAAADAAAVERLLDRCFGRKRHRKTCQRLREGRLPAEGLALVAREGSAGLVGTIQFWNLDAGGAPALLLGPVAVDPACQGRGIGTALIESGLASARALGHRAVILVGDPGYYGRFGFRRAATETLEMPGPVEPWRFLGIELVPGALSAASGRVRATGRPAKGRVASLPRTAVPLAA